MDKEELMKMAREAAGIDFSYSEFDRQNQAEVNEVQMKALYNAILERAATVAESEPKVWDLDAPSPQQRIAAKIREMKG